MASRYSVVLKEDSEDGGYVAVVPELPGCISDGDTKEQALENVKDAIRLYLQSIHAFPNLNHQLTFGLDL